MESWEGLFPSQTNVIWLKTPSGDQRPGLQPCTLTCRWAAVDKPLSLLDLELPRQVTWRPSLRGNLENTLRRRWTCGAEAVLLAEERARGAGEHKGAP